MKRTTVMLPADLRARAYRKTRALGISFGELVRESLAAYLAQGKAGARPIEDSLFVDSEPHPGPAPKDLAARHDDYLYGEKE